MRSPGVIYRRYRQLKKRYLYEKIKLSRKREHQNCIYGKSIRHENKQPLLLCMFGYKDGGNVDLCTCPSKCNAFISKWDKDKVVEKFEEELKDPQVKQKSYPELYAYEWVLDKNLNEAQKNPGFFGGFIVYLIIILENTLKFSCGYQKDLE